MTRKISRLLSKTSTRNELLNAQDKTGQTILHIAVEFGVPQIVKMLVEKKIDINKCDIRGWSSLAMATLRGDEILTSLLLNLGANPDQLVLNCMLCFFLLLIVQTSAVTFVAHSVKLPLK